MSRTKAKHKQEGTLNFLSGWSASHHPLAPYTVPCVRAEGQDSGSLERARACVLGVLEATAPGGRAPPVRSQSQAPGVAVAPHSARAPPPPWSRSRSRSRRSSPALEAVGLGQTDFLLFWETEGCGAAGCGLRAAGELAGGARTSLSPRIPTTLPRAGRDSGRPGEERGGRAPGRCGVAAAARSARQHRSLGGEWRGVGGWQ